MNEQLMVKVRVVVLVLILLVGLSVALSPALVYAPTPRVVLYFLISLLPAILFGAEVASKFEMKLPGFVFATGGAFAVCLGTLLVLSQLSKPEQQIAVFQVYDEHAHEVVLDWDGAVKVLPDPGGLSATKFVDGNIVILVFPEQAGEVKLQVKKESHGQPYVGTVTYAGNRTSELFLGKQLKLRTVK